MFRDEVNETAFNGTNYDDMANLMKGFGGLPSNASASVGDVLTKGANGNEWTTPSAGGTPDYVIMRAENLGEYTVVNKNREYSFEADYYNFQNLDLFMKKSPMFIVSFDLTDGEHTETLTSLGYEYEGSIYSDYFAVRYIAIGSDIKRMVVNIPDLPENVIIQNLVVEWLPPEEWYLLTWGTIETTKVDSSDTRISLDLNGMMNFYDPNKHLVLPLDKTIMFRDIGAAGIGLPISTADGYLWQSSDYNRSTSVLTFKDYVLHKVNNVWTFETVTTQKTLS